jgi:hypothetical protein
MKCNGVKIKVVILLLKHAKILQILIENFLKVIVLLINAIFLIKKLEKQVQVIYLMMIVLL